MTQGSWRKNCINLEWTNVKPNRGANMKTRGVVHESGVKDGWQIHRLKNSRRRVAPKSSSVGGLFFTYASNAAVSENLPHFSQIINTIHVQEMPPLKSAFLIHAQRWKSRNALKFPLRRHFNLTVSECIMKKVHFWLEHIHLEFAHFYLVPI